MKLNLKPLAWALVGAGVTLAGTASGVNFKSWWPHAVSQTEAPVAARAADAGAEVKLGKATAAAPQPAAAPLPAGATPNYRAIVQQYGPAVVGVTVEGMRKTAASEGGMPPGALDNDPFFQFFRGLPGIGPHGRAQGDVPFKGQGSGFIVSSDGLVLTNAHVVRDAKEVTVKLSDRHEYAAKVLGLDPATDIAVLRISAKDLPVVRLGDPKNLQVGDPVLAIGAPYGFEQSATSGIVSAKGRSLPGDAFVPFIQTDAAVNPGNSGGPLFDGAGNVIGINAQIYSQTGGFQGLSFAIPIDVALKVKDQIVSSGHAQHARIGVAVQDLNQALAESFGLAKPDGALVARVTPDSPAAKAGLQAGDVIIEVDGEAIIRSGSLSSRIGLASPGETVKLKVWRDKAAREVQVKLGRVDESGQLASNDDDSSAETPRLGLALRPLTRDERHQTHIDHGLVVEQVGGPAERAGIAPGDVVLAVNGRPVDSIDQLKGVLARKPKSVALLVQRDGERIFVPVDLGG